ncbi:MAG: CoA transferase [Oscillospiraceae bacterium]|nr:CoA transferase [Oscillospiraceae bacterium]
MASTALKKKAEQSQVIYEDLVKRFDIKSVPTAFVADDRRMGQFAKACVTANPFPAPFGSVLISKRIPGVKKLFESETVLQTPAISAVLAACSSVAIEIGALRGDDVSGAETYCDVAFAGLQAIRLYMADYGGKEFRMKRLHSAMRVDNAFNGSFYKYRAKNGRDVSFHVYYQSQQKKLAEALNMSKPSEEYAMLSIKKDRRELAEVVGEYNAEALEELSFDCGACGCMIRSREEWEATEVGKAVKDMPLIRLEREGKSTAVPRWGKPNSRGPLSGVKVLDLTHIIAGPACSRVLAEYGADVLLIRRGGYMEQEQAMLEFDGWAGKQSIQLDFNIPEQLEKAKELIKQADVITYSYQNGALDHFGLSEEDIRKLNPKIIYANLMCFSDTVWKQRPGWAPCAEDITGLSVRNGSLEKPVNLNGVPLDYFPGFVLALGTLLAIAGKLKEGGGYKVTTSLTRGAQYLHECTDLCGAATPAGDTSCVLTKSDEPVWDRVLHYVGGCATGGKAGFPGPAAVNTVYPPNARNLRFTDGNTGWNQK